MKTQVQHKLWKKALAIVLGCSVLLSIAPADARTKFRLPTGLGTPGRRVPGGARGGGDTCLQGDLPLTALIPESTRTSTTLADPTLFFYLPKLSATATLELIWSDETKGMLYKQAYKPTEKAGIVGFHLPANALNVGKPYEWAFSVVCDSNNRALDKVVEGSIERIKLDPPRQEKLTKATTPQERLAIYAEAGIWQDGLLALVQSKQSRPSDPELQADWEAVLTGEAVALDRRLPQQPIVPLAEAPKLTNHEEMRLP